MLIKIQNTFETTSSQVNTSVIYLDPRDIVTLSDTPLQSGAGSTEGVIINIIREGQGATIVMAVSVAEVAELVNKALNDIRVDATPVHVTNVSVPPGQPDLAEAVQYLQGMMGEKTVENTVNITGDPEAIAEHVLRTRGSRDGERIFFGDRT